MGKKGGILGLSFSWRRALGISQAQSKLSRKIGIPFSSLADNVKQAQRRVGTVENLKLTTI